MNPTLPLQTLNLVLIEDHLLLRENLKMGLELKLGHTVLGAFTSPIEAKPFLESLDVRPNVILMDVGLPDMDGIEGTYRLKQLWPEQKVLIITSYNDTKTIQAAFKVKAEGYCTKETSLDELQQALKTIMQGHRWLDSRVADSLLNNPIHSPSVVRVQEPALPVASKAEPAAGFDSGVPYTPASVTKSLASAKAAFSTSLPTASKEPKKEAPNDGFAPPVQRGEVQLENILSRRELDILKLVANNANNAEIAQALNLSEAWISGYIENITNKLSVNNEIEAVQLALDTGFVSEAPVLEQNY